MKLQKNLSSQGLAANRQQPAFYKYTQVTACKADNTKEAWCEAITTLIEQPKTHMRTARAAQKEITEHF
jgi:hypothetical protein